MTEIATDSDNGQTERFLRDRYGQMIDLGPCIVGSNLNLLTVRGFTSLDRLASISAPDVYDQRLNPTGTQRLLKPKHAIECFTYAMDAVEEVPEEAPRCFPEILLNARDTDVVELYSLDDEARLLDFNSFTPPGDIDELAVGVRVALDRLQLPLLKVGPQISRVDGNHRLSKTDDVLAGAISENEQLDLDFPPVAFSLLLELNAMQEASLFRDINGEHVGMEVAHLDSIVVRITDDEELKTSSSTRPLWLAHELAQPGGAFHGMVFFGGSREGVKQDGGMPPLRINSLKVTVAQQLKSAPYTEAAFGDKPEVLQRLIDRYWRAVARTFPEAWDNKRDFILLQSIGLGAFARLGGTLLDIAVKDKAVTERDFERYLEVVRDHVPLAREEWKGVAGAGGQKVVADQLLKAIESDGAMLKAIEEELVEPQELSDELEGLSNQ